MAKVPDYHESPDLTPGRRSCPIASTAASYIGYDDGRNELYVTWKGGSGAEYTYSGVSPQTYEALCAAPSKGKFLNRVIKGTTGGRAKAMGVAGAYPYKKTG